MQPLEDNPVGLAQQQLCLQKMDLIYDSWWVSFCAACQPVSLLSGCIAIHTVPCAPQGLSTRTM